MNTRIDLDGFAKPATPEKVKKKREREQTLQAPAMINVTPKKKQDITSPNSKLIISALNDLQNTEVVEKEPHVFNKDKQMSVRLGAKHELQPFSDQLVGIRRTPNSPFFKKGEHQPWNQARKAKQIEREKELKDVPEQFRFIFK